MGLAIGLGPQQGKTRCPEVFQNLKNCATLLTNCQDDLNMRNARAVTGVGSSSDESDTDITKGGVSFYAFLLFQMFTDIFFSFTSSSYTLQASGQVSFLYMFTLFDRLIGLGVILILLIVGGLAILLFKFCR